VFGKT